MRSNVFKRILMWSKLEYIINFGKVKELKVIVIFKESNKKLNCK